MTTISSSLNIYAKVADTLRGAANKPENTAGRPYVAEPVPEPPSSRDQRGIKDASGSQKTLIDSRTAFWIKVGQQAQDVVKPTKHAPLPIDEIGPIKSAPPPIKVAPPPIDEIMPEDKSTMPTKAPIRGGSAFNAFDPGHSTGPVEHPLGGGFTISVDQEGVPYCEMPPELPIRQPPIVDPEDVA